MVSHLYYHGLFLLYCNYAMHKMKCFDSFMIYIYIYMGLVKIRNKISMVNDTQNAKLI